MPLDTRFRIPWLPLFLNTLLRIMILALNQGGIWGRDMSVQFILFIPVYSPQIRSLENQLAPA